MARRYRLLASLGLLLASTFAVFALFEAAPGGPIVAYFPWLFRVLHGDLGWSPSNSEPVSQAIVDRLPATIELALCAFAAAVVLGAVIGFARTRTRPRILRGGLSVVQLLCRAIPIVVLAIALQLLLMFTTRLPIAGIASVDTFDLRDRFLHLIAPVLCLAVPFGAWSSLIFYDLFRRSEKPARPTLRDLVGGVAVSAARIGPALLSASLLIESRFAWPGIARLYSNGVAQRDTALVGGVLLAYSAAVVLLQLCAEFSTGSPRVLAGSRRRFSAIGVTACVVLLLAAFGALTAILIVPVGPYLIDQVHWQGYPLAPGTAGHVLGTDENGRDLLSRLLVGLRTSLGIAAFAAVIASAIAALVAMAMNSLHAVADRSALSIIGIRPFGAFPFILAAVSVLVTRFHTIGVLNPRVIALLIAAVSWPAIVPAFRALTPATLGAVADLTACALLLEVTLSLYGLGVQPPTPSLGNILANMQSNMTVAPWVVIAPTVVVIVTLFALYAVADELREGRTAR